MVVGCGQEVVKVAGMVGVHQVYVLSVLVLPVFVHVTEGKVAPFSLSFGCC